jgi:hypothetical protein
MSPRTFKFVTLVEGETPKVCDTFAAAFKEMFEWVMQQVKGGALCYQVLETSIWIEMPNRRPLYFYDARDIACKEGILVDGKLTI